MLPVPAASQRVYLIAQHGFARSDEYYWMRNRSDPETVPYLEAENAYLEAHLPRSGGLRERLVDELKARIPERDQSAPVQRGGYWYYTRVEPGREYPLYCRRPGSMDSAEEILLDQNQLAEGQPFCALGAFEVSPDQRLLAYLLDNTGSEIYTLYVKDLASGELLPERIGNAGGYLASRTGLAWSAVGDALYYTTLDAAQRPCRLYRHLLGQEPAQDELIYEEADAVYGMYITPSRSARYLWVQLHSTSSSEVRFLPLDDPRAPLRVVVPRQALVEYDVDDPGDGSLLILTNAGAQNFRLVSAPLADLSPAAWREALPERADVTLEAVLAFRDDLVVLERSAGLRRLRLSDPDGANPRYIPMPEPAYALYPDVNPEFNTRVLRFTYTSLVTPRSVVDYDMAGGVWRTVKTQEIPSGYDARQYATQRLTAEAADGARVPISLVYRKTTALDGSAPLLLYGYGSYGASVDPAFNANLLSLLERGFIYAIAHIRGGADLGRGWYEDGKLLKKKNTFSDFIACADFLVARGFTRREKLAIMGGSAGGLLVGAVMTMRPDLCAAVVARVPFMDVVTTMSDASIPLTTFEYDQWGNPADRLYFETMLAYSPYDNLRPAPYPATLITTGLNDPRVAFWEPAKFAARLRAVKKSAARVLLYTDFGAGHGGASGRYAALHDSALVYAFLIDQLGG